MINPMVVEGQVHGGIGHGIGDALLERVVYDEGGQLTTGTLMDYALPRERVWRALRAAEGGNDGGHGH